MQNKKNKKDINRFVVSLAMLSMYKECIIIQYIETRCEMKCGLNISVLFLVGIHGKNNVWNLCPASEKLFFIQNH